MHRIKNRCDYGQLTAAYGVGNQVESNYDGAFRLSALRRTNHRDGTNLSAWYAYDAFSRRIAKGVIENDKEKITRYGRDGDKLVHEATEELLTTIVYTPGSFAPLIRIDQNRQYMLKEEEQKSERERAMQEAMKQVEGLLAAEGIELKKPPPDPRWISVSFFVTDHAGTPMRLVNENGRVIWQAKPDDWGAVRNEKTFFQGNIRQPIRFQGQWLDEESGFYYNRYRFYDPRHGRYITQDPIGFEGGLNLYGYTGGDPISSVDPEGLDATNWVNREGGRSLFDGPTNGNWGGKCWSGGQYSCQGRAMGNAPPTDSGDACYQRHDICYVRCENMTGNARTECVAACDQTLVDELRRLDNDPRRWPNPPRAGTENDSRSYRNQAIDWFR